MHGYGMVVAIVSLIISSFVLWISFTANVRQHAWEFGVLRAIGVPVCHVMHVPMT